MGQKLNFLRNLKLKKCEMGVRLGLVLHHRERRVLDVGDGPADVDGQDVGLVGGRALQRLELTVDHVGAHVVALAGADALQQEMFGGVQEDEADEDVGRGVVGDADHVAIALLQRRARHDDPAATTAIQPLHGGVAEHYQPVPAVLVGQRRAVGHLVDVGLGVELVARSAWALAIGRRRKGERGKGGQRGGGGEGVKRGRGIGERTLSPSMNGSLSALAMYSATVVFPQPAGPVMSQM